MCLSFQEFLQEEGGCLRVHFLVNYFLSQDSVNQVWIGQGHSVDVDKVK